MKDLFSIGEVAKYQNISKQTLIFYDKIGLFCPAYVDPKNGYRYYSAKQLDILDTILIMKQIGFSLDEIKDYLQNYDTEQSLKVLNKQVHVIEQKIQELSLIQHRLHHRCSQMEEALKNKSSDVVIEDFPGQYILTQRVEEPNQMKEISIATKQCFAYAFEHQLPIYYQSGVIVPYQNVCENRCIEAAYAFLPIEKCEDNKVIQLSEGKCVSLIHTGDYASIGISYRKILNYCKNHSIQIISDAYEFCINDYITSKDENEYMTRIMFYIQEGN